MGPEKKNANVQVMGRHKIATTSYLLCLQEECSLRRRHLRDRQSIQCVSKYIAYRWADRQVSTMVRPLQHATVDEAIVEDVAIWKASRVHLRVLKRPRISVKVCNSSSTNNLRRQEDETNSICLLRRYVAIMAMIAARVW